MIAFSLVAALRSVPLEAVYCWLCGFLVAPKLTLTETLTAPTAPVQQPTIVQQREPLPEEPVETPRPQPAATPVPPQEETLEECPEGWGTILAQTYGQAEGNGAILLDYGSIKNFTLLPDEQVRREASAGLPFSIEVGSPDPQVLIMHTHATETYNLDSVRFFDPDWGARTTDTALNMCAVGQRISDELNAAGILTLHDETLHDYPSYNGSYAASSQTVQDYLARYPSIKVVLDVHRDAIERGENRIKPVTEIEGSDTAQVMIICGCDKNGNLPNYAKNLAFAAAWESRMEQLYPSLTRPVLFDYRYYNQDLTTGSLLIEIGGHANTLPEALNAGTLVGKALASLFTE